MIGIININVSKFLNFFTEPLDLWLYIESADLALNPVFNFLLWPNGSGKTSVLESIYALGHGRAFRSLQANHVICYDQDSFVFHERIIR